MDIYQNDPHSRISTTRHNPSAYVFGFLGGNMKYPSCSGIEEVNGKLICKHGFPLYPSCMNNPMKKGIYSNTPCINEDTAFIYFPETGSPYFEKKLKGNS